MSQEGATEFSRVQKKIFRHSVFRRKNSSLLCWVFCASFFVSGGRLLNRNISNDIWASFRPLLSLVFPLNCSCLNWADYFLIWSEHISLSVCVYSLVLSSSTVCVYSLVLSWSTVCVWTAWCCAQQLCVCNLIKISVCVGLTSMRGGVENFWTT